MGSAVRIAALDLRQQLIAAAAEALNTDSSKVTLRNGTASGATDRCHGKIVSTYFGMPGGELIGRGYMRPGQGLGSTFPLFWETGMGAAKVPLILRPAKSHRSLHHRR